MIILFVFTCIEMSGQDPQFSMFYSNSLYLSPSFAGVNHQTELNLSHRTQWYTAGQYITHTASYDMYIENMNSGVGVLFLNDVAGTGNLSTINVGLIYNYQIKLNDNFTLIPAMNFSYYQRSIDYYRLIWADQLMRENQGFLPPTSEPISFNTVKDIDFSTSILLYNEKYWIGTSFDHLLKPNESLYFQKYSDENLAIIPIKYQLYGGVQIIKRERLINRYPTKFQIAFLYKQQGEFKQLDLGAYYYHYNFVFGLWYRGIPILPETSRDAVVIMTGFKTKAFNVGYSYDFTISKLVGSTAGSHEINISYKFNYKVDKNRRRKMVPCSDF